MNRSLLLEIARCTVVASCRSESSGSHPCRSIVDVQAGQKEHQLPEPWNGDLGNSPILFVSSNPSICFEEHYPDETWSDDAIVEFFEGRFGHWMKDGVYGLRKDGTRGRSVHFNSAMKKTAERLLERAPRPGVDYCFTEVVHCKSKSEAGVREAQAECSRRYLGRILAASGARVVVVVGSRAHESFGAALGLSLTIGQPVSVSAGTNARLVVAIPHPGSHGTSRIDKVLTPGELERVRSALR